MCIKIIFTKNYAANLSYIQIYMLIITWVSSGVFKPFFFFLINSVFKKTLLMMLLGISTHTKNINLACLSKSTNFFVPQKHILAMWKEMLQSGSQREFLPTLMPACWLGRKPWSRNTTILLPFVKFA